MALWKARGGSVGPAPPAEQLQLHNLFLGGRGQATTTTSHVFLGGAGAGNDYNFKVGHGGEYYVD